MSGTTIIIRDGASPVLVAIQTGAQAGNIDAVMGRAVVNLTREHLVALRSGCSFLCLTGRHQSSCAWVAPVIFRQIEHAVEGLPVAGGGAADGHGGHG